MKMLVLTQSNAYKAHGSSAAWQNASPESDGSIQPRPQKAPYVPLVCGVCASCRHQCPERSMLIKTVPLQGGDFERWRRDAKYYRCQLQRFSCCTMSARPFHAAKSVFADFTVPPSASIRPPSPSTKAPPSPSLLLLPPLKQNLLPSSLGLSV
jgi:hypothetical protein